MDTTFEKIDDYLKDKMSADERARFEAEMALNEDLSSTFKIYNRIETEMRTQQTDDEGEVALKRSLQQLNSKYFNNNTEAAKIIPLTSVSNKIYRIVGAIAAVFVIVVAAYFLFADNTTNTQQLAIEYINGKLSDPALKMDASQDSLQQAKVLYKNKEFEKAIIIFQTLYNANSLNSEALKFKGLSELQLEKYDAALQSFNQLSLQDLFSNPGIFYKAVTLMKRNNPGDKEQAKTLLQQVVQQKLQGSEVAEKWLKEWK